MANDNIFQQYLSPPKSIADYSAQMDQADMRKNALEQSAMSLDGQRQDVASNNALSALLSQGKSPTDVASGLAQQGYGKQSLAYSKSQLDQKKLQGEIGKTSADTNASTFDLQVKKSKQAISDISSFDTPEQAQASLQAHTDAGDIDPAKSQAIMQSIPQDPKQFRVWQVNMVKNIMDAKDRLLATAPKPERVDNGQQISFVDMNPNSATYGQATAGGAIQKQQTPESAASTASAAAGRAQAERHWQEDQAAPESTFTPGAIDNAAARYNTDGTLPPVGMGSSGSALRAKILNRAAEMNGAAPADQRAEQIKNKGKFAAIASAEKSYAPDGKQGQAITATNTALNHLDTIEQLAAAQKNGDMGTFNMIANKLAAATGQAAPTNLSTAISMVAPEVSKAVIGAAGGQEERANFAKNFNPDGSPDQTLGGVRTIKDLLGGRLSEQARTYKNAVGRDDFAGKLSPSAQKVLAAKAGVTTQVTTVPNPVAGKPSLSDIFGK